MQKTSLSKKHFGADRKCDIAFSFDARGYFGLEEWTARDFDFYKHMPFYDRRNELRASPTDFTGQ